jgi:acyl-homoserine lactone acylase PvdQ
MTGRRAGTPAGRGRRGVPMQYPRTVLIAVGLAVVSVAGPAANAATDSTGAESRDYAQTARNVLPAGQYGSAPPPVQATDQADMYDGLTPLSGDVTDAALTRYFKSERFGTAGQGPLRIEAPTPEGVKIVRDGANVPHITGTTHDDVTVGAGWVSAEDRGLLLEQGRYNARVAAVDAPGLDALALVAGLKSFVPTDQTEREIAKQTDVLEAAGPKGHAVLHDIDMFVSGINQYYRATDNPAAPWTRNDVFALNALKGQFVGQGGGDEARRSMFLDALRQKLGDADGTKVFDDLREADDPEATASLPGSVRFQPSPRSTAGNVVLDSGSLTDATGAPVATTATTPTHASNALLVSADRSATGHPLMVAGPQIGYFYPGLLLEMDLHGPGIDVRGATTAVLPGYILIGRAQDYAWSLTSAGLDIIDTYVETLCDGSDTRYVYDGRCRDMTTFDAGLLKGTPDREITFSKTVHGPVVGYATVDGRRVAVTRKRASYGRDALDQLFYRDVSLGKVHNVHQFFRAAAQTPQTFNSFYLDDHDIGLFTSGDVPIRPADVDPGLPIDGRGKYEWRGSISFAQHPQGINPPSGQIVNWNNRPIGGYRAADDEWSLGAVQRVDLLDANLGAGKETLASVTSAMNEAATQDVRAMEFEPVLADVLRGSPAPNARAGQMLELLDRWHEHGGSRLDLNLDGTIDDPGAAIMDTAWPRLAEAWAAPVLGALGSQLATFQTEFDLPPMGQFGGWHIYMDKDLRTLLGRPVKGRFAERYCGGGDLAACRASLWAALSVAGDQLASAQGADPAAWRSDATRERIKFVPGVLADTMRYTNRPSGIQQVISFDGHRPGRG